MYEKANWQNGVLTVSGIECLNLERTLSCGQSFRWKKTERGWFGVAYGCAAYAQAQNGMLRIFPCAQSDVPRWISYFDLMRNYAAIETQLRSDARLSACLPHASGIRVLNQEPFETLITFILSANNNTVRIAQSIARLCGLAGDVATMPDGQQYARFPTPQAIAALDLDALRSIGAGYRAPYVQQSARMVADGFDFEPLRHMPLLASRKVLTGFPGVGPKVADCILLFSLGRADAFPIDVWIGRALKSMFFEGEKPGKAEMERLVRELGPMSGIIQQYVFHYARKKKLATKWEKRESEDA